MKRLIGFMILCLLFAGLAGAETVEGPKACKICGMDRTAYAHSRVIINYVDGTTTGFCSIHCAALEMKQNREKVIQSVMVADYKTKELTDAKTAFWVLGGKKEGVMTSQPKWAFAKEEEAQEFVKENGGSVTTFDRVRETAYQETNEPAKRHVHDHSGPGAQMLFNPAFGDQIYHTHPAGMWMFNYQYMHMDMDGLRSGNTNINLNDVGFKRSKPYNYMMIPTGMTMDMHMAMVMYGITDKLTGMVMANYQENQMAMLMDMGPGKMVTRENPMRTSGFGDMEIRGIYKINKLLVGSLGLNLPTGDINQNVTMMRQQFRAPYDMQLGSGTFDLKPSLTYNELSNDGKWNWGAQGMYTARLGKNANDYSLGNTLKVTSWLQRALGPVTTWMRLAYSDTGRINGSDREIDKLNHPITGMGAPTPDADPGNYGGQRLDGMLGLSYTKGLFSIGVEGGLPLYQYLNGLQMKTDWLLTVGIQIML